MYCKPQLIKNKDIYVHKSDSYLQLCPMRFENASHMAKIKLASCEFSFVDPESQACKKKRKGAL